MKDTYEINTLEQLRAISHPIRYQAINLLAVQPMTGSQLARALKMPRQRMHYHLKILRDTGLVLQVDGPEEQGPVEIYYQAVAENFTSPFFTNPTPQESSPKTRQRTRQRTQNVRDLTQAMLEQVRADLNRTETMPELNDLPFPFQYGVALTPEQVQEVRESFAKVMRAALETSDQNLTEAETADLIRVRYTMLITPAYTPDEQ